MDFKSIISNVTSSISQSISKICRPEPFITDVDMEKINHLIKPGDCLVSRTDYELSNFVEKVLTGSFYGHAAIYLDGCVYEATTYGVRKISLERFCYMKDGLGLCRLQGSPWTIIQLQRMIDFCEKQLGDEYDYALDWGNTKKWYCSHYVYAAWNEANPMEAIAIKSIMTLGLKKIIPQNIWDSTEKITQQGVTK